MTLPVPNLDNRKFQDIVDETKRRIALHSPEWTNHNISDPGVTLIELFAYMTEQTLYRFNQVPDRLYSVFLNMVGIEAYPAVPAQADLLFRVTPQAREALLPPRIEVSTPTGREGQTVFVTHESLTLRPPQLTACLTRSPQGPYRDQWDLLKFPESSVTCFEPLKEGAAMYLGFAEPLSRHVVRLRVSAETLGNGIVPEDPPLAWHISTERGWVEARRLSDSTGGLNRDGEIELVLPAGHAPVRLGEVEYSWIRVALQTDKGHSRYTRSPAIRTLITETVGGLVAAFHGEPLPGETLGTSDGTAGQRFQLSRSPVLSPWEGETIKVGAEEWTRVDHFGYSDAGAKHVVWHAASGEIEFGPEVRHPDGGRSQRGAIPPKGVPITVTEYRTGGGTKGNVGAGTLRVMRTSLPFVQGVTNLDPATGGEDEETVEAARQRAPVTLRSGRRAVTTGDYARLALEASNKVARAHCIDRRDGLPVVRVLLVPKVEGDLREHKIDQFAIDRDDVYQPVLDYLDARRLVGTSVWVGTPFYEGVSIAARVVPAQDADPLVVQRRCEDELYRYTHPIHGGPDRDGVPFGWTLTEEKVKQVLAGVPQVVAVDDVVLFGADLRDGSRAQIDSGGGFTLEEDHLFLGFDHSVAVMR